MGYCKQMGKLTAAEARPGAQQTERQADREHISSQRRAEREREEERIRKRVNLAEEGEE